MPYKAGRDRRSKRWTSTGDKTIFSMNSVVELLLRRSNIANIHEALMIAISSGHEHIAEVILKHPKYVDNKPKNKRIGETDHFFNTTSEDSPFSSNITPLILASERNQFEIVQLLLLRGETIKKPHHYYCNCQECSNKIEFDELKVSKTRLYAYRGLASSSYISLTSQDPIITAFELARELRDVSRIEKCFKTEYLVLADQLSNYVVNLLDKVRNHNELELLLNKKRRNTEDESSELLARMKLAILYNEKKFVAHPSCQQKLVSIWYGDLRIMERAPFALRLLMVLGITFLFPVMAFFYCIAPKSKIGTMMRLPCVKFIGHTMSYVAFLVLILISTMAEGETRVPKLSNFPTVHHQYLQLRNTSFSHYPHDFALRTLTPDVVNLCLSLWILGMLWQEIKQIYGDGIHNYFHSLYNYLDVAVLILYIASYTLKYLALFKANIALQFFHEEDCWLRLSTNDRAAHAQLYWLIADRLYWDSVDPHNVAEGLFAVANVISFTRVTHVLHVYELFGPMQISLTRMISDILKFGVIFFVVFVAFMVGLHNLYWYYSKSVRGHYEFHPNNITTNAEIAFGFPTTLNTVFWSLFGRGDPNVVELGGFDQYFIQSVGTIIFGAYNIATVIVLLNMLIAMMSRSFEKIQEEADTEWKFARSKIYVEYIKEGGTLPIPFNIIPTPKAILNIVKSICCRCRIKDGDRGDAKEVNGDRLDNVKRFVRYESQGSGFEQESVNYALMMKRIVRRYIFDVQRQDITSDDCDATLLCTGALDPRPVRHHCFGDRSGLTVSLRHNSRAGVFEEIKQDISSFRYEVLSHIQEKNSLIKDIDDRITEVEEKLEVIFRQQNNILGGKHPGLRSVIGDRKLKRNTLHDSSYSSLNGSCTSIEEEQ